MGLLHLFYATGGVGGEKLLEGIHLLLQFLATVGVAYAHTALREIFQHSPAMDVTTAEHSLLTVLERLVLYELNTMTIVDERIAGDAVFSW